MSKEKARSPTFIKPTSASLINIIRKRVTDKNNILFSDHAFDRQQERSGVVIITQEDVYRVLELGSIEGIPVEGKKKGEWKVTVTFRPRGSRKIGVATVILSNTEKLLITTVMWRDT